MKTNVNISNLKKVAVTFCSALVLTTGSFTQPNPDVDANDEMVAVARLEARMNATEYAVRFVAPAAEVTPELERLDVLVAATEAFIRFKAPVEDNEPMFNTITDNSTDIMLADKNN
jgi:hypothetical protein